MKVRTGFFLVLLTVAVLLSGTVFAGFQLYKQALNEQAEAEIRHSATHVSDELSTQFSSHKRTVQYAATDPAMTAHGTASQRRRLTQFVNRTAFSGASIVHSNGTMTNIVAGLPDDRRRGLLGTNFDERTYVQRAMQGETYVSEPIEAESGNYIVTISTPIRRDGEIVGTLNAAYHLPEHPPIDSTASLLERGHGVTIYSASGKEVYASSPTSRSTLVTNASVTDPEWTVSVRYGRQDIASTVGTVSVIQFGAVLVVLLSLFGFGWWVYRRTLHQVDHLLDGFQALADTEYGTEIDISGGDEWRAIEDGFNDLSHSLAQYESERRDRERSLREFKRAVEQAGFAVFITEVDGTITYVNPAFEEITGYSSAEALGNTPSLLNSGRMSSEYFTDLWTTLLDGREWDSEIINERRNGTQYWANQTITPLTDADGEIEEFVAIQADITDLRDRERHLKTLSRVLRHNLRNKINVITGYAEVLLTNPDVDDTVVRKIVDTGRGLTDLADKERLIIDLLINQRHSERLAVNPLLTDIATATRREYATSDISVSCPDDVDVTAIPELRRALHELIENSLIHSDSDDPSVGIDVVAEAETVSISIEDDGPGIPSVERRILSGDADIEPLSHGSGLGLWLVRHVVRLSDGAIRYDECTPSGSRITIDLPRP